MTTKTCRLTIRLEPELWDRLVQQSSNQGDTPVDFVRAAIERHLSTETLLGVSSQRIARVNEFQQLALDIIIREQFPEYRDRIIAQMDKLMATYHA